MSIEPPENIEWLIMRPVLKWGPAQKVAIEKHFSLCDLLDLHDVMDYEAAVQKALQEKNK